MDREESQAGKSPFLALGEDVPIAKGVCVFPIEISNGATERPFKTTVFRVAAGSSTPMDEHRVEEMWIVLKGTGLLEYESEKMRICELDRLFFPSLRTHRVTNDSAQVLQILSIYW
jgi:mannose-6-phosphate isomerase-like protein (cupin superfamily)